MQLTPVPFQCRIELLVLFLERCELTLGRVLLLLARLELMLGAFDFALDVRQKQVLVQRVDVAH